MHVKTSILWTSLALMAVLSVQAVQAAAPDTLPKDKPIGEVEQVFAFHDAMPTGVRVSEKGRVFVNFPRWGDNVPFTVGEIREDRIFPYPDLELNQADPN